MTEIKCKECCKGNVGGTYSPISGKITLCASNASGSLSENKLRSILRHELSHAESLCRKSDYDCKSCMIEEKKAYWRAGQCTDDGSCSRRAYQSCKHYLGCKFKKPEDFYGIGDPTNLPRIPQLP